MIQAVTDKISVECMRVAKSKHGIIIPDTGSDSQGYGRIASIGEDVPKIFEIGQILVYHPRAGLDTIMNESLVKIVKFDEVWGILKDKDVISNLEPIVVGVKVESSSKGGGVVIVP